MTSECQPRSSEEQKVLDSDEILGNSCTSRSSNIVAAANNSPSISTEIVFESMEDCVGCIDGIKEQQTFEESLREQAIHQRKIAMEHGLSEAEAALIRLQMIDIDSTASGMASSAANGIRTAMEKKYSPNVFYPQLDSLVEQVCGVRDSAQYCLDDNALSVELCEGVIMPMDTTLPTTLPINDLVESKQGKIARSLVDVAAESDAIEETLDEENFSVDAGAIHECAICSDSAVTCDNISYREGTSPSITSPIGSKKPVFCRFPCCQTRSAYDTDGIQDREYSNFNVCTACILVLTVATKDGANRVGRCPRCREWISISTLHSTSAPIKICKLQSVGECEGCHKIASPLIVEDPATCDECFLAGETSLAYECEQCHQPQTIQSTLYRSQPSAKSFGNEVRTCRHCEEPTHWRLLHDQLSFIAANDVPEEWGDDFLELARMRVQTARQGIAKLNLNRENAQGRPVADESCAVM